MSATASYAAAAAAAATNAYGTRQDLTDGGCAPHHPDLYAYTEIAGSNGDSLDDCDENTDGALLEIYRRDGYLVFDSAFSDRIKALDAPLTNLTTGRNQRFADNVRKVAASGVTPNFTQGTKIPWVQYETGTTVVDASNGQSLLLHPSISENVRKLMGFVGYDAAIDSIVHDEKLLQLVARLLDCPVDQVQLFQDMALLKPVGGREKPWHQDKAYFDIGVETRVVGCWIAMDYATSENGCLRFERGGHAAGPRMHYAVRDYQLCDADAPKRDTVVAVPLQPGGLVLFDGLIPHGTPTNTSGSRRRALQFHWIRAGAPIIPENEPRGRAKVFGGAPNGLSC